MSAFDLPTFDILDESVNSREQNRRTQTETIDLDPLVSELSTSGAFDFREIGTTAFGQLLQALPIPSLLIDPLETIIFANQTWERISSSYEKMLYHPFHQLFPDSAVSEAIRSLVQSVFLTRNSQMTQGILEIDQKRLWGRVHLKPLRIGDNRAILVLVEDLTMEKREIELHQAHQTKLKREIAVRKATENSLRASEQRTRVLLEVSPIGIAIIQKGLCVYANRSFREMFAYENGDSVLSQPIDSFINSDHGQLMHINYKNENADESAVSTFEGKGIKKDGKEFDVTVWQREILYSDESALMMFVADASEAKTLRSQLLHAQKMEAVGTLAGGIAHDFNNLLTVIQGCSELILFGNGKNVTSNIEKVLDASRKGKTMVERLLAFSRKVEFKLRPISLNSEVKQFGTFLERTIPKMIRIELQLTDDLGTIKGDPIQIEQILMNLALNARDAMPHGGTLRIQTRNVAPGEDCHLPGTNRSWVSLSVSDTGHGIEKEVVDHIFEPFFTTKEIGKGTGLGLASVYGIVEQHNGCICCNSAPGKGTAFHIYFPLTDELEQSEPKSQPVPLQTGGNETILLVDDEDLVRCLAQEFLIEAGYTVLTASDGKMALEVYQRETERISLIILDLIMPRMSGKECLKELLKINPNVKVLIASGYAGDEAMQDLTESGARGFIGKPYGLMEMLGAIRVALDSTTNNLLPHTDSKSLIYPKPRIDALQALLDLRDGVPHMEISKKYRLSARGLDSLLKKLREVRKQLGVSDMVLAGLHRPAP